MAPGGQRLQRGSQFLHGTMGNTTYPIVIFQISIDQSHGGWTHAWRHRQVLLRQNPKSVDKCLQHFVFLSVLNMSQSLLVLNFPWQMAYLASWRPASTKSKICKHHGTSKGHMLSLKCAVNLLHVGLNFLLAFLAGLCFSEWAHSLHDQGSNLKLNWWTPPLICNQSPLNKTNVLVHHRHFTHGFDYLCGVDMGRPQLRSEIGVGLCPLARLWETLIVLERVTEIMKMHWRFPKASLSWQDKVGKMCFASSITFKKT